MNGFDLLSPIYDLLAKIVFFNRVLKIQFYACNQITPESKILIVGGGNGYLLNYLKGKDVEVDYVELSEKMIANARKHGKGMAVNFFQEDFFTWKGTGNYDYIITPFFLDLISKKELPKAINKIQSLLKAEGQLIVCDFDPSKTNGWNKFLIKVMYSFFSVICRIPAKGWNDLFQEVENIGFEKKKEKYLYAKFIRGVVYQKNR